MTEDDTFNALRRQPFSVVRAKVDAMPNKEWNALADVETEQWFRDQGWTFTEFVTAFLKHKQV